jgi:hypothetical protein
MQKERILINDGFAAVMADGLAGRFNSAFPEMKRIIKVHPGIQILFKVDSTRLSTVNSEFIKSINIISATSWL